MTINDRKKQAKAFAHYWRERGSEKGDSQPFWLSLLRDIFGVAEPEKLIHFEDKVELDKNNGFIDARIPSTRVMIEQKSAVKNLRAKIVQSDGSELTPFQQAKKYIVDLPVSEHPKWVVICNFREFHIYDMDKPHGDPEVIRLDELATEYYRLEFLVKRTDDLYKREEAISLKAGELVGKLYEAIRKQYINPDSDKAQKSLNMLCVRLVFCLYAEDAEIFGHKLQFHNYIKSFAVKDVRRAIIELFRVLDQKPEARDPYLDTELASFPYVNGGLFRDEDIEIPQFTEEIVNLLLHEASEDFNWSQISPTIFGAVFESTLNPDTRRSGGMHYTSLANIHKVIDPLFLDELCAELDAIKALKVEKMRLDRADAFRTKLSRLEFFDPACGSGNFLTETYISLRRLENEALLLKYENQLVMDTDDVIRVSIEQFHGIEINDFAVTVAMTALWIAESQMMRETAEIVSKELEFLPLKSAAHIVEGNALRIDWGEVVPRDRLDYIMGNPPFVGFTFMNPQQKIDMNQIFPNTKNLDLVAAWYKIASDFIQTTNIQCGFVSTNSITQGETVASLWKHLNITINFAYRSFIWDSEATLKAHVHCVIIGFATFNNDDKWIYNEKGRTKAENINAYLCDAPNILVTSRTRPLCNVPNMVYGNKPADGGHLIIEDEDYSDFISREPQALKYIRPLLGATEYLHNKKRWCLWLVGVSPAEIKKCPLIYNRVLLCKQTREQSVASAIRKFAETPMLFAQRTQPDGKPYIIIPRHSSETRRYIPFGFVGSETIVNDAVQILPDAQLYHFGVLMSNVHMAWTRAICGRIKSDYRYSKDVVYNNFPWCIPTAEQKARIEQTAQAILDARALYPDCSLADLYDEITMPPELRKAHQQNDKAVMQAYGFNVKGFSEADCVAELMRMYRELAE